MPGIEQGRYIRQYTNSDNALSVCAAVSRHTKPLRDPERQDLAVALQHEASCQPSQSRDPQEETCYMKVHFTVKRAPHLCLYHYC